MSNVDTLVRRILDRAAATPDAVALNEMNADGGWDTTTWAQYGQAVRDIAKGLIALGHAAGECVAMVGDNRRDWVFCQFGIMAAGGVPAPIYVTNTAEQAAYIVKHCRARIAICDDQTQLDKYLQAQEQGLVSLEKIVTMDDLGSDNAMVMSLAQLIELGQAQDDAELDARLAAVKGDDLAMLIYTSGTTGVPKGAEFTWDGIAATGDSTLNAYPYMKTLQGQRYISYLPLCHAAEQAFTNFCGLRMDGQIYFCRDLKKIKEYLVAARPTTFFAVPRVWEKFEAALRGRLSQATGLKAKLAGWAMATELKWFKKTIADDKDHMPLSRKLARKLVLSKIKSALGLDALLVAGSGAAPISVSTLEFFASLGIPIHEGFGMTETTAFASVQPYMRPRFGTIGKALDCVQITIADDGEIMLKGPNMVRGYLHMPDKTAELRDADGWMHTGDLGSLDDDGFLRITGRKKDLIITAGGKNVAPAEMEGLIQGIPGVGQAVVVGDRQPYLCALIVLDEEAIPDLCKAAGVSTGSLAHLSKDETVRAFMQRRIESDCNTKVARYQTIKKFEILPHGFSVDTDELTPTLKVKRNVVNDKYASVIAGMYDA